MKQLLALVDKVPYRKKHKFKHLNRSTKETTKEFIIHITESHPILMQDKKFAPFQKKKRKLGEIKTPEKITGIRVLSSETFLNPLSYNIDICEYNCDKSRFSMKVFHHIDCNWNRKNFSEVNGVLSFGTFWAVMLQLLQLCYGLCRASNLKNKQTGTNLLLRNFEDCIWCSMHIYSNTLVISVNIHNLQMQVACLVNNHKKHETQIYTRWSWQWAKN